MSFLATAKKYSKGLLTEQGTFNLLSRDIDFQFKNQWECFLYSSSFLSPYTVLDNVAARLFMYSITIPSYGFEYKKVEGTSYAFQAIYPESVTMTFLEDAYGLTRRWIQHWMDSVAIPYRFDYGISETFGTSKTYRGRVFKEDQKSAKRDAMILLNTFNNLPLYPRIMLYGLRPHSIEEITIGHEEHEDLRISLVCSIDEVEVPWLI